MDVVSITDAKNREGLRLITRQGAPTPWSQAAKGIIEMKGLPCVLAQESSVDPKGAHADWVGDQSAPFVAYNNEPMRGGWVQILELAERLAPEPRLVPAQGRDRAEMYGLANEICGEMGLGWSLRLLMVDESLRNPQQSGAFPKQVATYLGGKYGHYDGCAEIARVRVRSILSTLSERLGDARYILGDLSALDIYWAAFGNMFMLLNEQEFPTIPFARDAWTKLGGGRFTSEVPANLKAHHRYMYEQHLGLPVQL